MTPSPPGGEAGDYSANLRVLPVGNGTVTVIEGELPMGVNANGENVLPGNEDTKSFEVPAGTLFINATLAWTTQGPAGFDDVDVFFEDANGRPAGQAASLAIPEQTRMRVDPASVGTWTARVVSYHNPATSYTLTLEMFA